MILDRCTKVIIAARLELETHARCNQSHQSETTNAGEKKTR